MTLQIKEVKQRANGRWKQILTSHGIHESLLKKQNSPCPVCGGHDRFRWDDKNGNGGGYCHQCNFKGDGLNLLGVYLGLTGRADLPKLLSIVMDSLGASEPPKGTNGKFIKKNYAGKMAAILWEESAPMGANPENAGLRYLRKRGLKVSEMWSSLRFHSALEYWENGSLKGRYPALVAKVADVQGKLIGLHRIYLTNDGDKALVTTNKKALGVIDSGAIRFGEPEHILNVAEGVETALAVHELTGGVVWSAISATNLTKLMIPETVDVVRIWADLDKNYAGEKSAINLAHRLTAQGFKVILKVPKCRLVLGEKSIDWLDIYNHARKEEI